MGLTKEEEKRLAKVLNSNLNNIAVPQMASKDVQARQALHNIAKSCSPEMREYLQSAEKGCREVGESICLSLELVEEAKKHHLNVIRILENYNQKRSLNMLEIDQVIKKLDKLNENYHC